MSSAAMFFAGIVQSSSILITGHECVDDIGLDAMTEVYITNPHVPLTRIRL